MYLRVRLSNLQSAFRKISIPLILRLYIESRPCSIIDSLLVLLDFPRLCRTFARHPHTISHNHQKARCVCLLVIFCDLYEPNGKLLAGISAKILAPPTLLDFNEEPLNLSHIQYSADALCHPIIDRRTNIRKNNRELLLRICYNIITAKRKERTL